MEKNSFVFIILISFFTLLTSSSFAQQTYYKCIFDKGSTTNFDRSPSAKSVSDKLNIVFENINYSKGIARQVGENGSAEVSVVGGNTINFFERTGSGNFTFTTIFRNSKSSYNAVHSRHIDLFGAIVSQYYGICN